MRIAVALAAAAAVLGCAAAPVRPGLDAGDPELAAPAGALAAARACSDGRPTGMQLGMRPAVGGEMPVWAIEFLGEDRIVEVRVDARTLEVLGWEAAGPASDAEFEQAAVTEDLLGAARIDLAGALAALRDCEAGFVVSAELGEMGGRPVYVARILRDGRIRTVAVDARSGEVVLDGGGD